MFGGARAALFAGDREQLQQRFLEEAAELAERTGALDAKERAAAQR